MLPSCGGAAKARRGRFDPMGRFAGVLVLIPPDLLASSSPALDAEWLMDGRSEGLEDLLSVDVYAGACEPKCQQSIQFNWCIPSIARASETDIRGARVLCEFVTERVGVAFVITKFPAEAAVNEL